jgi:hypothetical protein
MVNKLLKAFRFLSVIPFFLVGCSLHTTQPQTEKRVIPKAISYRVLLGKSITDSEVADFITSNTCSGTGQSQLCEDAGIALWINTDQTVETIYLYLNDADGFVPYKGELPLRLKFYDSMGAVQYKLKKQKVGKAGLPDSGETPDHLHYWANYQEAGMIIVYNSPSEEDEDATIYAILLNK